MDANAQMEMMEQHLLFHKALAEDEEEFAKINGYIATLRNENNGEKLSNEVDESVRAMFNLVIEKGMDPWAIDLEEFARLYSERISNSRFDMLVAGRLLLMAWKILKMQSEQTRMNADTPEPVEEYFEDDFSMIDEDYLMVPDVSLTKAIAHVDPRPVTMYDLIGALEEAKKEAEAYEERRRAIANRPPREAPAKFDNKAHKEDDETVVERIYQRIYSLGMEPMPITEFYTGSKEENISVFVSVLHLVRNGRLEISQETLPYGEIMVQIIQPKAEQPLEIAAVN